MVTIISDGDDCCLDSNYENLSSLLFIYLFLELIILRQTKTQFEMSPPISKLKS